MSDTNTKIMLRAWYRFEASDWLEVRRSGYLAIRVPHQPFMLDAFYDPGHPEDAERPPTVVFRGYLVDTPTQDVLSVLQDDTQELEDFLEPTVDGLGALSEAAAQYIKEVAARLARLTADAYDLLRWRHRTLDGPTNFTIDPASLFWAPFPQNREQTPLDSLNWRQVPSGCICLTFRQVDILICAKKPERARQNSLSIVHSLHSAMFCSARPGELAIPTFAAR